MADNQTPAETDQPATDTLANLLRMSGIANLCDEIDERDNNSLTQIGRDVVRFGKLDDDSRADWKKKSTEAMELATQVVEEKTVPWPGASNVKYPLLTVAALQFHARTYPAIITGNTVVRGQITGRDDDGLKAAQSKRVTDHMNWQLLSQDEEWEPGLDAMLLALPVEGCEFKKSFYSSAVGRNKSEWVRPIDLIVNSSAKSLTTAPRITHRLFLYPYEIDAKIREGLWRDANLQISQDEDDEQVIQEFWEQHCFLDLDGDGNREPYIVTVHLDTEEVVRVVAGYDPASIVIRINGREAPVDEHVRVLQGGGVDPGQVLPSAELVRVPRIDMFTKFTCIPSPDGSFYDLGFGQLIGPLADSIDTIINQLIDSGTLANRNGGFVSDGVSVEGRRGNISMEMGEFKRIKIPATKNIQDALMQLKFNEPSMVLFQLLGTLITSAKEITSVQEIMTGGGGKNESPTTAMIKVEQGVKMFLAIFKRVHRSLKQEFQKLYRLNKINLQPEEYFRVLDSNEQQSVSLADYRNDGTDVQPVSDPQMANNLLAMAKSQMLMQTIGHPLANAEEILRRHYESLDVPAPDKLIIPAEQRQPPPDPKLQLEVLKAADQHIKVKAEIVTLYARALQSIADAESKEIGTQLQAYASGLKGIIDGWQNDQGRGDGMAGTQSASPGGVQGLPTGDTGGLPALPGPGQSGPGVGGGEVGIPTGPV